jgi:hypothetical protein
MSTLKGVKFNCKNHPWVIIYKTCVTYNIGGSAMNVTATETKKAVKSSFNDEFENYLKKQQIKTTFNGSELESFSWYKKALGLS